MKSKNILVATSLFCSRKNWPALLRAVDLFTKTIYERQFYCLEFNYLSGENIRFSFLTNEETADDLLKQTDQYFKDFFLKANSCNAEQNINKGIFKLFEKNTICYGLYEPITIRRNEKKNYVLQFTLSEVIIDALKDEEELDDEAILTFAYYLVITVIQTSVRNRLVQKKILFEHFEFSCRRAEQLEKEFINAKFRDNQPILEQIFDSIENKSSLVWVEKWKDFIVEIINKKDNLDANSKIFLLFDQIKLRLGFTQMMESLLNCFIFRIITKKIKN